MPGKIGLNKAQGILPRLWCAVAEDKEVKIIVLSEVAIATWVNCEEVIPTQGKIYSKAGTIIRPPPIPSNPAKKPTKDPNTKQIAKISRKLSKEVP